MLNHNESVADVTQMLQGGNQPLVIPLMQANRRLIEHVQHPRQTGSDLGGKANTLRFPARKGTGGTVQRQVVQTDVEKKLQTCLDFLQHGTSNHFLALAQLQRGQKLGGTFHGQRRYAGDGQLTMRTRIKPH